MTPASVGQVGKQTKQWLNARIAGARQWLDGMNNVDQGILSAAGLRVDAFTGNEVTNNWNPKVRCSLCHLSSPATPAVQTSAAPPPSANSSVAGSPPGSLPPVHLPRCIPALVPASFAGAVSG